MPYIARINKTRVCWNAAMMVLRFAPDWASDIRLQSKGLILRLHREVSLPEGLEGSRYLPAKLLIAMV